MHPFFISWTNRCLYANREISLDFSVYSRYCTCITHSTCIVSTFLFFGILTGCKPQYIALYCVNFPWRLFFLWFAVAAAALSFVCLFIQIPLDLLDERKQRKHSKWRQQAAYLSFPSSSSCSMLLLLWIGGFFLVQSIQFVGHLLCHTTNMYCSYLLWCRGNVVAVVASCSRNSLPFLRRFVKMTLLFQFYHCLCRECNVTKKEETSERMKLCYFSVLSSSCSICFPTVCVCRSPALLIIVFCWKQLYACEGEIMINWE